MEYLELSIVISPFTDERAEIIEAMISDLGFESFIITDPFLKAYIKKEVFSASALKTVLSYFDNSDEFSLDYSISIVHEQNWNLPWESSFEPIVINKKCTIKADYHKNVRKTRYNIIIKPNMAFGTGHHQTTSLMIQMMFKLAGIEPFPELVEYLNKNDYRVICERLLNKNDSKKGYLINYFDNAQVLDMGTGTGVLAILAAKLGALRPVHAIDIDIRAVNSAKENLWNNRMHKAVEVLYGDASYIQRSKYDIILANINRNILIEDMSTYSMGLKPGAFLVVSGFYWSDVELLMSVAEKHDLTAIYATTDNDVNTEISDRWAVIVFKH